MPRPPAVAEKRLPIPVPTARNALPVLSSEVSAARRAVIEVVKAVVSAPPDLGVGLVLRVEAVVLGPVDFPVDRELPRLGAPFLTVMASTLVAPTTLFTAAPRDRW